MDELISIVVPIYNIENYIGKCIESILHQTYKNFELLLINDGSTDNSLEVCKRYETDYRCMIFTKENGGLSDARNYGIARAKGKYITFIDGDDSISPLYLENLILGIKNGAEISISGFSIVDDNTIQKTDKNVLAKDVVVKSPKKAIEVMLYQKGYDVSACGKLYLKELFTSIQYPKGVYFEDLATTYKLVMQSSNIAFINTKDYYYYIRIGSITKSANLNKKMHIFSILEEIKDYFIKVDSFDNDLKKSWQFRWERISLDFLKIAASDVNKDKYLPEIKANLHKFWLGFLFDRNVSCINKMKLILALISVRLYMKCVS